MATTLETLKSARDALALKIAAVAADPRPSYSVGGQSVQHAEYFRTLTDQFDKLTAQIVALEPYCFVSQVL